MNVVATIACAIAVGVLLFAEYARHRVHDAFPRLRAGSKIAASLCFLVVGASALTGDYDPQRSAFDRCIFVGLVFGAIGDVALLGKGLRAFMGGLVAFLCGHIAYCIAVWTLFDPRYWLAVGGWPALVPIVVGSSVHEWLKPHLDPRKVGKLRLAVGAYIAVITVMVIAALATARSGLLPDADSWCFLLGACLFFASDFAVARERFVVRDLRNKLLGLPAYYAGQLLIAWAIA